MCCIVGFYSQDIKKHSDEIGFFIIPKCQQVKVSWFVIIIISFLLVWNRKLSVYFPKKLLRIFVANTETRFSILISFPLLWSSLTMVFMALKCSFKQTVIKSLFFLLLLLSFIKRTLLTFIYSPIVYIISQYGPLILLLPHPHHIPYPRIEDLTRLIAALPWGRFVYKTIKFSLRKCVAQIFNNPQNIIFT